MIRTAFSAALIAASLCAGIATAQTSSQSSSHTPSQTVVDPSATTFTGWVKVSGREFQLYSRQQQLNAPFARPCVSGALPRDLQRSSQDLAGTQVTFTGRAVPWASRGDAAVLMYEGSRISNDCGGEFVIQADSVRVLRGG
jgi:hypothetical protein